MSRIAPLCRVQCAPEFDALFALTEQVMGFVPNSMLTMARDRDLLVAFAQLSAVIVVRPGRVDPGLKALIMYFTSHAAGCLYCSAHSANLAATRHVALEKIAEVWHYERSPLFSEAERAALRLAQTAAQILGDVTDQDFTILRRYFDEDQILEIVAVIAFMGFLNRWNDTLATPLEPVPHAFAERHLATAGWKARHHAGNADTEVFNPRRLPIKVRLVMWLLKRWGPKPRFAIGTSQTGTPH